VLAPEQELRLAAEHWRNSYSTALHDAQTIPNVAVVRFEDFVAEPEATIRRLCAFLDLELEPGMIPRAGDRLPFATLPDDRKWYPLVSDRWLAQVSHWEAAIIASECEPLASELGYGGDGILSAADGDLLDHHRDERPTVDPPDSEEHRHAARAG
jgi:hypothetical protein